MGGLSRTGPEPPTVYPIADSAVLALELGTDAVAREPKNRRCLLSTAVESLTESGASWIQVRSKDLTDRELFSELEQCCRVVAGRSVALWINDRADLAAMLPVSGVHLGQDDLPPRYARKIVGNDVWIGRSTHTEAQFAHAAADPDVDVVALGPIFSTSGKKDAEAVVGIEILRQLASTTSKPVVAIGGISRENLTEVLAAGADSASVLGAVCRGPVGAAFERLSEVAKGEGAGCE